MTPELLILCCNALAYIVLFIYFVYKKKSLNLGIIVLGIFTVSAICSAWYYSFPKVCLFYPNITVMPLVF